MRDGDLDIYAMDLDGTHPRRLTQEIGYDGGAFFSPDSKRIVYRAQHPSNQEELAQYKSLLAQNLVEPGPPGNLHHECRRVEQAAGDEQRRVQFLLLFPSGWAPGHFFSSNVETRNEGAGLGFICISPMKTAPAWSE